MSGSFAPFPRRLLWIVLGAAISGALLAEPPAAQTQTPDLPDLVIENIGVDGGRAVEGVGAIFTATVKNQGTAPTPPDTVISVTFYDATGLPADSKDSGKQLTYSSTFRGPLAPGQSQLVLANAPWGAEAGTHTIRAVVDDVRRIVESDRSNNTLAREITVERNPDIPADLGPAEPSTYQPSANEAFPNGNFEETPIGLRVQASGGEPEIVALDGGHAFAFRKPMKFAWNAPDKIIQGADYLFSCRVKAVNVGPDPGQKMGFFLWLCRPAAGEPAEGGGINLLGWNGSFNWKHFETPFKMLRNVSRFVMFLNSNAPNGWSYVDGFSIRPVDDQPLDIEETAPVYGSRDREQMTWIWNDPAFPWEGAAAREFSMSADETKPVPRQEVWFRRTVTAPSDCKDARAVFVGDDSATLAINGKTIGSNISIQDIETFPLKEAIHPGENEILWKVINAFGPGGLLGRIEWTTQGVQKTFPTNGRWECSSDQGATWRPASEVAVPVPAPATMDWCYPHLPKLAYELSHDLPDGIVGARLAVRSPGGFRVLADGRDIYSAVCCSHTVKVDLSEELSKAKKITVVLEDIAQPPAGAGLLELKIGDEWKSLPFSEFRHDGAAPQEVKVLFSTKSWPTNIGSFEAAASRPSPDQSSHLEPWAQDLLAGATPIFQIGRVEDTSAAFAPLDAQSPREVELPLADPKGCPRGLQPRLSPEVTFEFSLEKVPPNGAAFVLGVEDANPIVNQVGVFVNGLLCGMPQIVGYSACPGGRPVNRAWIVTLPKERLRAGANTLTLRLVPSYYSTDTKVENQSQEYIEMMGLGDAALNPYQGPWIHWNYLALQALAKPVADPINGRPVWMGTNLGYIHFREAQVWKEHVIRDLSYIGLTGIAAPIRYAVFDKSTLAKLTKSDLISIPDGQTLGDYQLSSLVAEGMRPHLLTEPGRGVDRPEDLANSLASDFVGRYGKYAGSLEIGNEVDNPNMGWDSLKLADAYATLQRQAVCAQMLKKLYSLPDLKIVGQGWYHAWDFSVVDAQARQETPDDPAWTDQLSTHNYGKSYIISAVGYRLLYGTNPPKPIWTTECGSWSADLDDAAEFDGNIRGNLSFATYILQYLCHSYDDEMSHFSLLLGESATARILERCRSYRRLVHAYGLHGTPLAWQYADPEAMRDKLVYVNPVAAGKWIKISFVNFSKSPQPIDVRVTLPQSGTFSATRYGDAPTVAQGIKTVTLNADPQVTFKETLGAGETVEYLLQP